MKKIFTSNKIYISKSKISKAERGVFAKAPIQIGEVIEICPIVEIPKHELESLVNSALMSYVYFFGKKKDRFLVALGFGSIYNHNYFPTAMYKINPKEKIVQFVSLKKIKKDEEITVNYIQGDSTKVPLWFEK